MEARSRYYPGSSNDTHFEAFDNRTDRFIDFGPDNYVAQFFTDGRSSFQEGLSQASDNSAASSIQPLVFMAWASNLRYAADVPTGWREGWRGLQTLPRAVVLTPEWDLVSHPVGLTGLPHHILGAWEGRGDNIARFNLQKDQGAILIEGNITFVPWASVWLDEAEDDESGEPKVQIEVSNKSGDNLIFRWILPLQRWRPAHFTVDRSEATGDWNPPREYRRGRNCRRLGM